jgi:hypothetical protein
MRPTAKTLEATLVERLRKRTDGRKAAWTLDLRRREWAHLRGRGRAGVITIRNPADPRWPRAGATTSDRRIAEEWVRSAYADWFRREETASQSGTAGGMTTAQAAQRYLDMLQRQYPTTHNTRRQRESVIRRHLLPTLGDLPLASLDRRRVQRFLETVMVRRASEGRRVDALAAARTRDGIRDTLRCIWREVHADTPPPFAGIRFGRQPGSVVRREAAAAGAIGSLAIRSYTRDQVLRLLGFAALQDEVYRRANLRHLLPMTCFGIALLVATGARIEEITWVRWIHLAEQDGAIYLPGTKTENSQRWVPYQASLHPWIARLRELVGGRPEATDLVLRLRSGARSGISRKTLASRIAGAQRAAGLKVPQKASHILRSTHLTWGLAADVHLSALKAYLGHASARGGATDDYVDRRPTFFPPAHRQYIALPTPEEVETFAESLRSAG